MPDVPAEESPERGNRTTIFDVAREAGVSYSTVSRVVNGQRHVSAATRERVQRAMRQLGYTADVRARALAGGRTRIIGLVLLDITSSFMTDMIRAVDEQVASSGYDLMLCTTHARGSMAESVRRLAPGLVDGLVVLVPMEPEEWLGDLQRSRRPHVLLDHHEPTASSQVRASNREGVEAAVDHLADLGHREAVMIAGDADQATTRIRTETFRAWAARRGMRARVVPGGYNDAAGFAAASSLLREPELPTAVFAANDGCASGVLRAARELGVDVPAQLSVVGFDDVMEARLAVPRLTTVHQPMREMSSAAVRLLLDHIEDPAHVPRVVELQTRLVVRESTAPPRDTMPG